VSSPSPALDPLYYFEGAEYPPTKLMIERGGSKEHYVLNSGKDKEPRGVCLVARLQGDERQDAGYDPQFVLRIPDLEPLPAASKQLYIDQFEREIDEEVRILQFLSADAITEKLIGGDAQVEKVRAQPYKEAGINGSLPALRRKFVPGRNLYDYAKVPVSIKEWFSWADKLIRLVHSIHLAGIPHGYICPTNVVVGQDSSVYLINFERDLPDPTLHVTEKERGWHALSWRRPYDSPERRCFLTVTPGSPQPQDPFVPGDLYSLGLLLLWLATGERLHPFYGEEEWKVNGKQLPWYLVTNSLLKSDRKIREEIRELIGPNPQDKEIFQYQMAAIEVIFACLRLEDHRFHNVRSVLEVLRQCSPDNFGETGTANKSVGKALESLCTAIDHHPAIENSMLGKLYRARLERALLPFDEENAAHRYTAGTREEIVDALVTIFRHMDEKGYSHCEGMTTPTIFHRQNCSPDGRVFSLIRRVAAKGVHIQWLFVVNQTRMNSPDVIRVMSTHIDAWKKVEQNTAKVRWLPLDSYGYRQFLRDRDAFLYFYGEDTFKTKPILVLPDYAAEPGRIIALRVFPQAEARINNRVKELRDRFDKRWARAYSLNTFPHATII